MALEVAYPFEPIPGVSALSEPFGSISFAYEPSDKGSVSMVMHGARDLHLRFTQVIALRYEDDCPGFDDPPLKLFPMLKPNLTFPLLRIENSVWLTKWSVLGHKQHQHFVFLSLDNLVQIIALPDVTASWGSP